MHALTTHFLSLSLLLVAGSASALDATSPAPDVPVEQRTERITHEDAGSRIDELRIGGQTRSIEVKTKSALPGYQVQPFDAGQPDSLGQRPGNGGHSSWRLIRF